MHIYGSSPRPIDRLPSATGGTTYASANHVTDAEMRRAGADVEAARSTALSALKNDRFGMMLSRISDPATSGALMTMRPAEGSASAGLDSVLSSYAENDE